MNKSRKLKVAFGLPGKKNLSVVTNEELGWEELVARFETPARDDHTLAEYLAMGVEEQRNWKNKGYFVGGHFTDGKRRKVNLECRSVVTLDVDDNCDTVWDEIIYRGGIEGLKGFAYHVHTTRKHTIEKPRFRVIVPLAGDITKDEYELVVRYVAELVDGKMLAVAAESFVTAQLMFMPSVCSDGEFFHQTYEGKMLDAKAAFKKYDLENPDEWPVRPDGIDSARGITGNREHPEAKKRTAPIITAVQRAFTPEDFIEEFLSHHYEYVGEGRYLPAGATGAASVRIYDDAFIHSDHSSDAARGQHTTFDVGRLVLFGELDDDIDAEDISSPVEMPSYIAMDKFMREQPAIVEALEEIRSEIEEEDSEMFGALLPDLGDDDLEDDEDDLIGTAEPKSKRKKPKSLDEYCDEVFRLIRTAENVDDLQRICEAISGASEEFLKAWRRENFVPKIMEKAKELGASMTKAFVRKEIAEKRVNKVTGGEDDNRPEWLDDLVFVSSEGVFYDTTTSPMTKYTKDSLNLRYMKEATERYGALDSGVPMVQPTTAALASNNPVPRLNTLVYDPREDLMPTVDGELCLNAYRAPVILRSAYRGVEGVKLFKRLMADLFPERDDYDMAMDFIAHCVKYPGIKLPYALLVKGSRAEGKSTIKTLINSMLGIHNCNEVNNDNIKEKFTGWIMHKCFVAIEEVKMGGLEAYAALEKLKPLISNNQVSVRAMNKDSVTVPNLVNFYMMTNHENALPLDQSDNRYLVLFTRFHTDDEVVAWKEANKAAEGVHYVKTLNDHIRENPWQFKAFFDKYEFSKHYDPSERAPVTRYRALVAENAKSDAEQALEELLQDGDNPCISNDVLILSHLKDEFMARDISRSLNTKNGASFLVPLGFRRAMTDKIMVEGERKRYAVFTRNLTLLKKDGSLTDFGKQKVRDALRKFHDLENDLLEDLDPEDLI